MAMLAMTILVHFSLLDAILGHCATYNTHPKVQEAKPAALYCNLATWIMLMPGG
jgi:hypothetical protein